MKIKAMNIDTLNFLKSLFLFEPKPEDNWIFDFINIIIKKIFNEIKLRLIVFRDKMLNT